MVLQKGWMDGGKQMIRQRVTAEVNGMEKYLRTESAIGKMDASEEGDVGVKSSK